jgi:hypothetical protein
MIYLIGVNHEVQYLRDEILHGISKELEKYITDAVGNLHIGLLAEEMNEEALLLRKAKGSLLVKIAKDLNIEHRFCDPNTVEREQIGAKIEVIAKKLGLPQRKFYWSNEVAKITPEDFRLRESFWLDMIKNKLDVNIIFLCGDDHIESFGKHLAIKSIDHRVLSQKRWHF